MPVMRSTYAAATIIVFMLNWNNYLWPLIVLQTNDMKTVTLVVSALLSAYTPDFGVILLATVLATLPTLIIFFLLQRQFVEGMLGSRQMRLQTMRSLIAFNDGWIFNEGFSPELTDGARQGTPVTPAAHRGRAAVLLFRRDELPAALHLPEGVRRRSGLGRPGGVARLRWRHGRCRVSSERRASSPPTRTATRRSRRG